MTLYNITNPMMIISEKQVIHINNMISLKYTKIDFFFKKIEKDLNTTVIN